jgi:hypothetical protein
VKLTIAALLMAVLGLQIASAINTAARDVSQPQKAVCKKAVML